MSRQVRNLTPQKWLMWKNSGWVPRAMVAKLPCFSRQLHHPEGQIFYGLIHTGYASVGMELDLISIDSQKKNWTVSIRFTHFWSVRLRPTLPNVDTAGCLKKKTRPVLSGHGRVLSRPAITAKLGPTQLKGDKKQPFRIHCGPFSQKNI